MEKDSSQTAKRLHGLPRQFTPFIGREEELAEITRLLADPTCALLTLLGPGGAGKTRLSLETASRMSAEFADGVYFVPLQAVESTELLVSAVTLNAAPNMKTASLTCVLPGVYGGIIPESVPWI